MGGLALLWDATRDRASDDREALQQRDSTIKSLENEQKKLAQRITSQAGKGRCNTEVDCRVVGLGAKPCGKYLNFLFYSMTDADATELEASIKRFNANQAKLVDLSLAVPNCGVDKPAVDCIDGVCADPARYAPSGKHGTEGH